MPAAYEQVFLQQGLLGALFLLAVLAIVFLFRQNTTLHTEKVQILRESINAAAPLADAIKELTNSHKLLADKVQRLEDVAANRRR